MIIRSTLYTARGGDTTQVLQTAKMLAAQGIAVDVKLTHEAIDYSSYNLLHFFNITRPADILYHIRKAKLPFVVSTILINYSEFDRLYRRGLPGKLFRLLSANTIEYVKIISRWALGKDKLMSVPYLWQGHRKSIKEVIEKAGLLLPNSLSEHKRLQNLYGGNTAYSVVPNGVDNELFYYNKKMQKDLLLVLCVARFEGIKNQLKLIEAINNTKYKLVLIGAPAPNQMAYYNACRKLAASNITFVNQLQQKELVCYYQQAKVHVLASWFETTGLSSLEAAAMGCNIVITDKGDTKEYFENMATYCDPASAKSIYEAVETAAALPFNQQLQKKISTFYTWQQASLCTAEGYKKIMQQPWH